MSNYEDDKLSPYSKELRDWMDKYIAGEELKAGQAVYFGLDHSNKKDKTVMCAIQGKYFDTIIIDALVSVNDTARGIQDLERLSNLAKERNTDQSNNIVFLPREQYKNYSSVISEEIKIQFTKDKTKMTREQLLAEVEGLQGLIEGMLETIYSYEIEFICLRNNSKNEIEILKKNNAELERVRNNFEIISNITERVLLGAIKKIVKASND